MTTIFQSSCLGTERFNGRANFISTERLDIAPLTSEEAKLYLTDVKAFASALQLAKVPNEPDEDTRRALNWLIDEGLKYGEESSVWFAIWAIIDRQLGQIVANACFKGEPIEGEPEIGYGTEAEFRNQGYMTEAVGAFISWGRRRGDLRGIIAETVKTNVPSQRVLEKNGFQKTDRTSPEEDSFFWRVSCAASE